MAVCLRTSGLLCGYSIRLPLRHPLAAQCLGCSHNLLWREPMPFLWRKACVAMGQLYMPPQRAQAQAGHVT